MAGQAARGSVTTLPSIFTAPSAISRSAARLLSANPTATSDVDDAARAVEPALGNLRRQLAALDRPLEVLARRARGIGPVIERHHRLGDPLLLVHRRARAGGDAGARAGRSRPATSPPRAARSGRAPRPGCASPSRTDRSRESVSAMWLPVGLRHLLLAVETLEQRHGHADLRFLTGVLLVRPAHQQVEELIRTAELDVGAQRDRVVRLRDRVEEFVQRDRRARRVALARSRCGRASARRSSARAA